MKGLRIAVRIASGIVLLFVWACVFPSPAAGQPLCVGDCNDDGACTVNELVFGVNIGLGIVSVAECAAFDPDGDEEVSISELLTGVNNGLYGCAEPLAVTKTEDTNDGSCDADCSLREAIIAANADLRSNIVNVPAGVYVLTLEGADEDLGASGDLDISGDLTLIGAGAEMTVIDGNATDRVFDIHRCGVSITGITIRNGQVDLTDGYYGGGVFVREGTGLELTNSTLSGNSAQSEGGGIFNGGGPLTLRNTTLIGNSAGDGGGGIFNYYGEAETSNTIIANSPIGGNCAFSAITSGGHNLDDDGTCNLTGEGDLSNVAAHLTPTGDYGGPTDTHALCTGPGTPDVSCTAASPALDAGDNEACPDTDQRGVERPQPPGGFCDIGAYEAE